ncbi:MAG TPA: phage tail tip lysozyme [Candidatus Dormibacteraeota bacterium]|nr:phage tail tip lysozyme [Candidatus Dormibacteraeota bacterium]
MINIILTLALLVISLFPQQVFALNAEDQLSINTDTLYYLGNQCSNTTSTTLVGNDNLQKAYNFLTGKGLTAPQASAVIGNLEQESGQGLNPLDQQNGSSSNVPIPNVGFGIGQWTDPGRQQGLVLLAQKEAKSPSDLGVQLDYLWQELTSSRSNALVALKATTNVGEATSAFEKSYEDAGDPQMQNRVSNAELVLKLYGDSAGINASLSSTCIGATVSCGLPSTNNVSNNSTQLRQNIVCIAQQELALWETQPGSNLPYPGFSYASSGFLKYSQQRYEEWCADFVSWVYNQASYPLQPNPYWSVPYVPSIQSIGEINQNFHWHTQNSGYIPKPGDLAIYGDSHVNIFISSSGARSIYIGGDQTGLGQPRGTYGTQNPPSGSIVSIEHGNGYYDNGITGYVSPD